jgi:two-component system, chemotaxis family, CheB/CheR fusion protein
MLEELDSSNEELRSANEEFQSTNEELETSKEELQSANEELQTVNSELSRKNAALDQANSDLQNLLNSTQIPTLFLDSSLHIKNFTPAASSVFRLISSDVGRALTDISSVFGSFDIEPDIREVLKTLTPREQRLRAADGRYFQMRILPYRTVKGAIEGVVVTLADVTDLRRVEIAEHARAYAENIVNAVREPLLVLDPSLRVQMANRSFYRKFQVAPDETECRFVYDLGNRQWDIPELRKLLGEILPRQKVVDDFTVEHDFPGIGRKSMLLNARQIQTDEGDAPLILLAIEDTSEREWSKRLEKVNEELQHFAYAISHDLREPLRMVTTYSQLLARDYKDKLDPEADKYISFAVQGATRIENLLNGLREYWSVDQVEAGHRVPVNSNLLADQLIAALGGTIRETGGAVTHDPLPVIMGDEVSLTLLLQNLILNALKYHRPGQKPQVHISARRTGSEWTFSVADNGIGIPSKQLTEVFTPFKRLRAEYPGSGLGLAICKKIVEHYGGKIWAESATGKGSTFSFTIPAREEQIET